MKLGYEVSEGGRKQLIFEADVTRFLRWIILGYLLLTNDVDTVALVQAAIRLF